MDPSTINLAQVLLSLKEVHSSNEAGKKDDQSTGKESSQTSGSVSTNAEIVRPTLCGDNDNNQVKKMRIGPGGYVPQSSFPLNMSNSHSLEGQASSQRKISSNTNSRGNYRCSICGKFKSNHICHSVEYNVAFLSKETQTSPLLMLSIPSSEHSSDSNTPETVNAENVFDRLEHLYGKDRIMTIRNRNCDTISSNSNIADQSK